MAYKINIRGASAWDNILKDSNIEVVDGNSNFGAVTLDGVLDELFNLHTAASHTVASHNDTTATGAELETLTDGSNADLLHGHIIESISVAPGGAFWEGDIVIAASYTVSTGKNALTAGPITLGTGVTITVPAASTWTVV